LDELAVKPGDVLCSRYEVVCAIGSGGMGAVYKVWRRDLSRFEALKILKSITAENVRRLERESVALSRLEHDHIVKVYTGGVVDARTFHLSME
jgi:eukaryotic-like serine/threonine-protein kinase